MRRPGVEGLKRVVTGTGRWVRPGRGAVTVAGLVAAVLVVSAAALLRWATSSASPARTLALTASVLREAPALDSALEVTWTWSVGGTAELEERWLALVAPSLPPGICLAAGRSGEGEDDERGEDEAGLPASQELDEALRQLDAAVRRGARPPELERRLLALRSVGAGAPGSRTEFLVRYGLARGYGAAGDWATAAEVLEPALQGWISSARVPETTRQGAAWAVETGRVDEDLALDAVHGRYLAGTIAYRRGEPDRAVAWFRRAINAVHYLLAARDGGGLGPEGHYQRVVADPGPARCPGTRPDEALTSLDAYAGLVAAYMADEGFRDPGGLPAEVARTRLEIDPDDPFGPVLEHARLTRGDPGRTPIPENLLWAASNLQRVYHYNRLRPDPRLEVTRAVLLLHLTGRDDWVEGLQSRGGADVCRMLAELGDDLQRDASVLELGRVAPSATDSARAAVAVQTFARLERDCDGVGVAPVEPRVRSAWVRLGGPYLTRGVGGVFEGLRSEIVQTLKETGGAVPVLESRLAVPVERARVQRRALHRGRIPGELPADLPVDPVRRYVDEWWSALFSDVAASLVARIRQPESAGAGPIRAGEVPELLTALESAVDHAGLRPEDVYGADETTALAATGGTGAALAWRLRTWIRNRPWTAAGGLAGAVLLLGLITLLVHVSWWRYRLLSRQRFYVREAEARARGRGRRAA